METQTQDSKNLLTLTYFSFLFTVCSLLWFVSQCLYCRLSTIPSRPIKRHGMHLWPTSTLTDWVNPKLPEFWSQHLPSITKKGQCLVTHVACLFVCATCNSCSLGYLNSMSPLWKAGSVGWKQQKEHNATAQSWTPEYNIPIYRTIDRFGESEDVKRHTLWVGSCYDTIQPHMRQKQLTSFYSLMKRPA